MPLAAASATSNDSPQACEAPGSVRVAYQAHQRRTGRGNSAYATAARAFLRRWPDARQWEAAPLDLQLHANCATRPLITFLLVTGRLHPGWDYLVHRRFSAIWRDVPGTVIGEDLDAFIAAARSAGHSQRVAGNVATAASAHVWCPDAAGS